MDRADDLAALTELRVHIDARWQVASLRYFDRQGDFARGVADHLGAALPEPLRISARGNLQDAGTLLAWRSPTESLLLSHDTERMRPVAGADGCFVDQSGGRRVLRIEGARGTPLLARLGSAAMNPPVGGSRSGRLADLPAVVLRLTDELLLVVVDRVYAEHLLGWVAATAQDLA